MAQKKQKGKKKVRIVVTAKAKAKPQMKKPVAKAKKKPKHSHSKRIATSLYDSPIAKSYEETLLDNIRQGKGTYKATEYALLFNSVMSSLTPSIRNLYYKSGISAGRILYRMLDKQKRYMWYEESVADLVSFLENAGFSGITYNVFPDKVELKFHNRNNTYIGSDMHIFESGLISGFLTAGKQQHVIINEVSCSNAGSDLCHFISMPSPVTAQLDGRNALNRMVTNIKPQLERMDGANGNFAEEYYILRSAILMEKEYASQLGKVIYHIGSETGSTLGISQPKMKGASKTIEDIFMLLNLGELKIESIKPLKAEIRFPMLRAKKEFVDISITFLSGVLSGIIKQNAEISTTTAKRGNSYIIRIAEKSRR